MYKNPRFLFRAHRINNSLKRTAQRPDNRTLNNNKNSNDIFLQLNCNYLNLTWGPRRTNEARIIKKIIGFPR